MKTAATIDKLLTAAEVADLLGIQPQTLAVWRSDGRGPRYVKVGVAVRYRPVDIQRYCERNLVGTVDAREAVAV